MNGDDNRALVLEFLDAWSNYDPDALAEYFSDDATYWNVPTPPMVGKAAIRDYLRLAPTRGVTDFWFETLACAAEGDLVFTERVDHFRRDGRMVDLPVAGVFTLRDGKILVWNDYYDLGSSGASQQG